MSGENLADATELGPAKAEYKGDFLETHGTAGTIGLLVAFAGAIFACRSVVIEVHSEGIRAILDSPVESIAFGVLLLYCLLGLFSAVMNITDRVVVYRDGLTFRSRFPRRFEVWRWEDIERVRSSVTEDKRYRHKEYTYTLCGKDGRRTLLAGLHNMEALGRRLEEAVSSAKWSVARQSEPEIVRRDGSGADSGRVWQVHEELLAVFDFTRFTEEQARQIRVSPDCKHVAYVDVVGENSRVVLDQQAAEIVDAVVSNSLTFSPDGSRFAFVGGACGRLFLFVDERRYGPFKGFIEKSPLFSPDSQRIAYAAQVQGGIRVYLNDDQIVTAEKVGDALIFSPDSQSIAFKVEIGLKQCIVLNGRLLPFYDQVDNPQFSPNSRRLAYAARRGDNWVVVVDGVEGPRYRDAAEPMFSPDSGQIAYYARAENGYYLVVDDRAIGPHDAFGQSPFGRFKFSPDSARIAFVARQEELVRRQKKAYIEYVVVDALAGRPYERCGNLVFSANGARLGYLTYQAKKYFAVVDGHRYGPFDDVREDSPVFSPDSKTFAFSASELGASQVYVDGEPLDAYRLAYSPVFGPDSQHYAFGAYTSEGCHVVVDGNCGKRYGMLMCAGQVHLAFEGPHQLHYVASSARAPDHWLLVTEKLLPADSMETTDVSSLQGG